MTWPSPSGVGWRLFHPVGGEKIKGWSTTTLKSQRFDSCDRGI